MIQRSCAGGVVFHESCVFLLKTDKGEWGFPKGRVRDRVTPEETALARVFAEGGLLARIVEPLGQTRYNFFSSTRKAPVDNRIDWFLMQSLDGNFRIAFEMGFLDGGFYPREQALQILSFEQDRALLDTAIERLAQNNAGPKSE